MEAVKKIEFNKIIKLILIAGIGTLLLTISAKIKIPFYPVPMTMQTFVVLLLGVAFGYKIAVATVGVYLLEGILGIPVFSNSPEKRGRASLFYWSNNGILDRFFICCLFFRIFKLKN